MNSNHFNESASRWDTPEKIKSAQSYANHIKNQLSRDSNFAINGVLEIGCGTGLLGSQFMSSNYPYLGIDSSIEMLKVLKEKFPFDFVKTQLLDIESDQLPVFPFNLVLSQMAFHHLSQPDIVLKKVFKIGRSKAAIIDLLTEDGSFHPDPNKMGVKHFGFSKGILENWAQTTNSRITHFSIINEIHKNNRSYPIFLAIFEN